MEKNPLKDENSLSRSMFYPPMFPPEAALSGRISYYGLRGLKTVVRGCLHLGGVASILSLSTIVLILLIGLDTEFGEYKESPGRDILLEGSAFFIMDENSTEIAAADLLPGDLVTFTHTGNITEIVHSSTSCSSSSSTDYYGESDQDSYYGGEEHMECWTDYYTHYRLNASSVMFETSSVNEIYQCHRSTCTVTGKLVDVGSLLVEVQSVEVIA